MIGSLVSYRNIKQQKTHAEAQSAQRKQKAMGERFFASAYLFS
jgi:hypothetical protein